MKKDLLNIHDYFGRFYEISQMQDVKNYEAAFLILESEFFEMHKIHKYKNYASFREAKSRYNQQIHRRK
jgi:hypothetical protein